MPRTSARLTPGDNVFTRMTRLAVEHRAVNLGQGFPDFDGPAVLREAATEAMARGENQYVPSHGIHELRMEIAHTAARTQGVPYDPDTEVTVTSGCTESITAALLALVEPGDEVLTLEPFYDNYPAMVALAGGRLTAVPLALASGRLAVDLAAVRAAVTPRTRVLLVNTPHNPTGMTLDDGELRGLAAIARDHDLAVISDEVYEHITFDRPHGSIARHDGMRERTLVCSSAAKTFSITGWRIGWTLAPPPLTDAVRRVHRYLSFCAPTPLQRGVAVAMRRARESTFYRDLATDYRGRRALLLDLLARADVPTLAPEGTYFILARTDGLAPHGDGDPVAFCEWLTREVGVTALPLPSFYAEPARARGWARFAFCKRDEVLVEGGRRLLAWRAARQEAK